MNIRKALPEDSSVVGRVHSDAWKSAYRGIFPDEYIDNDNASKRAEEFLESVKDGKCTYFILEENGQAAGIVKTCEDNNSLEIESIYILEEHRGKGLGGQFIDYIKTYKPYDSIFLWVLEVNTKARRFYEQNGFKVHGKFRTISRGVILNQLKYVLFL